MKQLTFFGLVISLILMSSCNSIQNPTLDRIEGVTVNEMNTNKLVLDANMVLKNPNIFALDLAEADLKAIVDDIELATIKQSYETSMPANSEFNMPVSINLNLADLYKENPLTAISKGLKIMGDRKLDIKFVGTISVGRGSAKVSVPVDQVEVVEF